MQLNSGKFLLYSGLIVLRRVVKKEVYTHFVCLSIAIRIMLSSNNEYRNSLLEYAHHLLAYFVSTAKNIYGNKFNTYNVHNLIHPQGDVANYQLPLDSISGFAFENHPQILKKLVCNAANPVSQIIKRTHELESCGARYSEKLCTLK